MSDGKAKLLLMGIIFCIGLLLIYLIGLTNFLLLLILLTLMEKNERL